MKLLKYRKTYSSKTVPLLPKAVSGIAAHPDYFTFLSLFHTNTIIPSNTFPREACIAPGQVIYRSWQTSALFKSNIHKV